MPRPKMPADLERIRMCDWWCKYSVDELVDGRGPIAVWMLKRVLRRQPKRR
jgi:hypothetical protein